MDRLFDNAVDELQHGGVPAAAVARIFEVDLAVLSRVAGLAFPLSVRSEALRLYVHQLLRTVEDERRDGRSVREAISRLRSAAQENAVTRLTEFSH